MVILTILMYVFEILKLKYEPSSHPLGLFLDQYLIILKKFLRQRKLHENLEANINDLSFENRTQFTWTSYILLTKLILFHLCML